MIDTPFAYQAPNQGALVQFSEDGWKNISCKPTGASDSVQPLINPQFTQRVPHGSQWSRAIRTAPTLGPILISSLSPVIVAPWQWCVYRTFFCVFNVWLIAPQKLLYSVTQPTCLLNEDFWQFDRILDLYTTTTIPAGKLVTS